MIPKQLSKQFRVDNSKAFHLSAFKPDDTGGLGIKKDDGKELLAASVEQLRDLQERLYAQDRWAVLIILQGMDTAGKDGVIEHVMSGVNPQGVSVFSFKAPSAEELDHDFMWRTTMRLPERGRIGIFNRSYYEELLVPRVHPEILARQKLHPKLITRDIWKQRFADISAFEKYLAHNGTIVLKFFLNISKNEQRDRLLARLDLPEKRWKFSLGDIAERKLWLRYMAAYQDMIRNTASSAAPWHIVPADRKWFARLVVASALIERMKSLNLKFPKADRAMLLQTKQIRKALSKD